MIKLPDETLVRHFDASLRRGTIIRLQADDLDDPARPVRMKFAVVLSVDCSDEKICYAFTTSQLQFFDENPQFSAQVLRVREGQYAFWPKETIINLRQVREIPRENLKSHILAGSLTFEGELQPDHLEAINGIVAASPVIERRIKKRVLAS